MTDDEIRGLVRLAIQKHLGTPAAAQPDVASAFRRTDAAPPQPPPLSLSFSRYVLPRAADDTMCIIESEVKCNHCGYCQCHGH
jgi:hypothetical protein